MHFLTHIGYPPFLFLFTSTLANSLVPFRYALFTPPRAARETLLMIIDHDDDEEDDEDEDKKGKKAEAVHRPSAEAKDQRHRRVREWQVWIMMGYYVGVVWLVEMDQ